MKTRTWYDFIPFAGRLIQIKSDDLLSLQNRILMQEIKLKNLKAEEAEIIKELDELVQAEWTQSEIEYAQEKYQEHVNS